MAAHHTEVNVKGFKNAVHPMQWMRLMMMMMGMLGVNVRKIKALTVKMEIATVISKGR
jgi:hypothetical protein